MNKKFTYTHLVLFILMLVCTSQLFAADSPCSCDEQTGPATNIGIELVTCETDATDTQRVSYTEHVRIYCNGTEFSINPSGSNPLWTGRITPNQAANLYKNTTYRVFKNGTHILAIHRNFTGIIGGVDVDNYSTNTIYNDIITCPYIFPPLNEEADYDGDGIVDCIDNCPEKYNPEQGPCTSPLETADTTKKDLGTEKTCPSPLQLDPVNVFNGNLVEQETDVVFNTPFEQGLAFKRVYNSQSTSDSNIGYGWTHNYNLQLHPDFDGNAQLIEVIGQTGRGYYFEDYDEDGTFNGAFSEKSAIEGDLDGNYRWTTGDGTVYKFEQTTGMLLSITDKSGNTQSLAYSAENLLTSVTDLATGRILTFFYNAADKIDYITGPITAAVPDGIWVSFGYDIHGNLTHVTYADNNNGSSASGFVYQYTDLNDANNLTSKTDLAGHELSSWIYNNTDQVIININPEGKGGIIDYTDPNEVAVTTAYGITSIYSIQEIAGRKKIVMTSNATGCNTCSDGIYQTAYDEASGVPTQREYFNGRIDLFQNYDSNDNPQTIISDQGTPDEKTILKTYHPTLSTPLTITQKSLLADAGNPGRTHVVLFDYDDPSDVADTAEPNENPTHLVYKKIEQGFTLNATQAVISYEYVTVFTYNTKGQVLSVDGPLPGNQDLIQYNYDPVTSDLLNITMPITGIMSFLYDAAGNITSQTDINNIVTLFTYDGRNRKLTDTTDNKTASQTYTAAGLIQNITDRSSRTLTHTYDTKGLLERITNIADDYLSFAYDANANLTSSSVYSAADIRSKYTGFDYGDPASNSNLAPGKPWKTILRNPENTADLESVYQYEHGNVVQVIDPEGGQVNYQYDRLDRVIQQTRKISDTSNAVTIYAYDTRNNLISVTDANHNQTLFAYDDSNRLIEQTSPDTGTTRFVHDMTNNQSTRTFNDSTAIDYHFDVLGRLTLVDYADDSENITYQYDLNPNGMGRLSIITDPSGTYEYTYDTLGRLVTEEKTLSGAIYLTHYSYDEADNLLSITYPSGRVISYDRNSSAQTTQVFSLINSQTQVIAQNISHLPFGPVQSFDFANGKGLDTLFDLNYQPRTLTVDNVIDNTYGLDSAGNIEQIIDNIAALDQSFIYNNKYELTNAQGYYGTFDFTYDPVGNRNTQTLDLETQTYTYLPDTNKIDNIVGASASSYGYNLNGCIESKNTRTFEYSSDNRLKTVRDSGTIIAQYQYNSMGQRVTKTVNSITTVFLYDIFGNLIAESTDTGDIIKEYVYLLNTPLAMIASNPDAILCDTDADGDVDGLDLANISTDIVTFAKVFGSTYNPEGSIYFYHTDHLGTPKAMTDMTGQIVWQANHSPFGAADIIINTVENNLMFPGQYYDTETGLHYNYHRYYDPDTGRYLTPDPIGLAGGINPFVYTENNPVNLIDPIGLWSAGFGAYAGLGGDVSYTSTTCCKNQKQVKIKYLTFCGGVGIGGKLAGVKSLPISAQSNSIGVSTYGNSCPKTGDMFVAQQATVAVGVGGTGTAQAGNRGFGAEASGTLGLGVSLEALKLCAIIILDEDVTSNCCQSKGDRLTDVPWQ